MRHYSGEYGGYGYDPVRVEEMKRMENYMEERMAEEEVPPICEPGRSDYLSTFTGWAKLLQILIGIIICCTAGIYCLEGGQCTTNPAQVRAGWQSFVILTASLGIVLSFLFFAFHFCRCCPAFSWRGLELFTLAALSLLYIAAAILETYLATLWEHRQFVTQWSVAAAFCWINLLLYVFDGIYVAFVAEEKVPAAATRRWSAPPPLPLALDGGGGGAWQSRDAFPPHQSYSAAFPAPSQVQVQNASVFPPSRPTTAPPPPIDYHEPYAQSFPSLQAPPRVFHSQQPSPLPQGPPPTYVTTRTTQINSIRTTAA